MASFKHQRQHKKSLKSQVKTTRDYDKFGNLTLLVSLGNHTLSEKVADNSIRIQKATDKLTTQLINL
jgi:hypothetical protein